MTEGRGGQAFIKRLRMLRVMRLMRMTRLRRVLMRVRDKLRINPGVLRLAKFTLLVSLVAHYNALVPQHSRLSRLRCLCSALANVVGRYSFAVLVEVAECVRFPPS